MQGKYPPVVLLLWPQNLNRCSGFTLDSTWKSLYVMLGLKPGLRKLVMCKASTYPAVLSICPKVNSFCLGNITARKISPKIKEEKWSTLRYHVGDSRKKGAQWRCLVLRLGIPRASCSQHPPWERVWIWLSLKGACLSEVYVMKQPVVWGFLAPFHPSLHLCKVTHTGA